MAEPGGAGSAVRRLYEAYQRREWDAAAALLRPDAVVTMPSTGERLEGRPAILGFQREYPEPWGTMTVRRVVAGPASGAAAEVEVAAPDGRRFALAAFWEARDGALASGVEYWTEVGGSEPPPTRRRAGGPAPTVPTPIADAGDAKPEFEGPAIQDLYPDELAHCFGCGRLNAAGHHLRSFWTGDGTVARFTPAAHHVAIPGFVHGGLLASLVDCHATGTAAAAAYRAEGRAIGARPAHRFVTASLRVDFRRPTPLGLPLRLDGRVRSIAGRKVVVAVRVAAGGTTTVEGEVVCVELPASMAPAGG